MSEATQAQRAAIEARGNVLIMAGAGTGKTRTLVGRCVEWVLDEAEHGSLEAVLMVTFTKAAAAEMRQRIRDELLRRWSAQPGNPRLAEQLALLDAANIGTIHSFCHKLVRQHFYELGLDPQFNLMDENQSRFLMHETFQDIINRHYASETPISRDVQQLVLDRARGCDDLIRNLVFRLHDYSRSLRNPKTWLDAQLLEFERQTPQSWDKLRREGIEGWMRQWLEICEALADANPLAGHCAELLRKGLKDNSPDSLLQIFQDLCNAPDTVCPRGSKTANSRPIKKCFEEAEALIGFLPKQQQDPLLQDWEWTRLQGLALLNLTVEFSQAYASAKRNQALLDFSDLEQFTLQLLSDGPDGAPSPVAQELQKQFRLILVDEYQDINDAQDAILSAISRRGPEANRFLVGDVKQSIYRFRRAAPHIFQRYARDWSQPGADGRVIPLQDNFRSHEAIIDAVNALFSKLMIQQAGGIEYDDSARLLFGAPDARPQQRRNTGQPDSCRVEMHLLRSPDNDDDEESDQADALAELSSWERQARLVAWRLRKFKEENLQIWDSRQKKLRPAEYRDMVILLRAPSTAAEIFAKEFSRFGVPLSALEGNFYECIEVADLVNLLRILDNPLQDLPLLAVLRSPLAGLSLDELAEIRLAAPRTRYWTALMRWHQTAPKTGRLFERVNEFLERYARWRALSRQEPVAHCLEVVLDETHYIEWCRSRERGAMRVANVRKLLNMAREFDPWQRQGLGRFLKTIEQQIEAEEAVKPPPAPVEDAVRLMSIHQAKGLEFPVVVLAGLDATFNLKDIWESWVVDEEHGLCPRVKPPGIGCTYPSVAHWFCSRRQKAEALGEEMRLLYVALTRAAERLILTATIGNKIKTRWSELQAKRPAWYRVLSANCYLDWVGPLLHEVCGSADWLNQPAGEGPLLRWAFYDWDDSRLAPPGKAAITPTATPDETESQAALWENTVRRLEFTYPYAAATVEPAKTTVSLLRRRALEELAEESQPAGFLPAPRFARAYKGATSLRLEAGLAQHHFLELMDLSCADSPSRLEEEATRLVKNGMLEQAEARLLDFEAIAAFWNSETGRKILQHRESIQREAPFTARLDTADFPRLCLKPTCGGLQGEFVVVQGVVDLLVLLPAELWVLDFKTDAVSADEADEKALAYKPQLQIYGLAMSRIYNRPATNLWLHFLRLKRTIRLPVAG